MNVAAIQNALRERGFDAWLFYDHHHRDPIAYKVLGLSNTLHCTRRWYYLVPAVGEPVKLNHRVEPKHLDSLPGSQEHYGPWPELHAQLKKMVAPYKKIAMQYSPNNNIMYVSLVDGGTIELLRSFGANIESSANLVAQFEAVLTDEQIATHFTARDKVDKIMEAAFKEAGTRARSGGINEYQLQQWLGEAFKREGLVTDDLPIVGVNENAGNPHYSPEASGSKPIREGDWLLLDMWAKLDRPDAVYYDITWCGFLGKAPSDRHREIFNIVMAARDMGIKTAQDAFAAKRVPQGWEVDEATRAVIAKSGYGEYFVHRTGHSIGVEVHGNGANMDNLETKDDREILPNTLFSIEPGIYLPEFGVRLEVDMLVRNGAAEVTGRIQREIVLV
jgi:Xaa-Pro dipeptidase